MTDRLVEERRVGLCVRCAHVHPTVTDRGSVFYRCGYAALDLRFPKYPAIPVRTCGAYSPAPPVRSESAE